MRRAWQIERFDEVIIENQIINFKISGQIVGKYWESWTKFLKICEWFLQKNFKNILTKWKVFVKIIRELWKNLKKIVGWVC